MTYSLFSKVPALKAQRSINRVSDSLEQTFTRLSSGLRINKASDDAAGLAISESLKAKERVYSQAVRNANDAVSQLNVAQGGLDAMTTILVRLRELATQSANGSYSLAQRRPLDEEGAALVEEFNRILESTKFNDQALFEAGGGSTTIQLGFGAEATLQYGLADELERRVATGGILSSSDVAAQGGQDVVEGDFDNDGDNDLIIMQPTIGTFLLYQNDGAGNFAVNPSTMTIPNGPTLGGAEAADINGDGNLDFVVLETGGSLTSFLGDGNGTFTNFSSVVTGLTNGSKIRLNDINSDGSVDVLMQQGARVYSLTNNGSGAFSSLTAVAESGHVSANFEIGDFNGDGNIDFVGTSGTMFSGYVYLGNGNGGFSLQAEQYVQISKGEVPFIGDVNNDGYDDIVGVNTVGLTGINLSNGDGTFTQIQSMEGLSRIGKLTDFNGDGLLDIVSVANNYSAIAFGAGDGTFGEVISNATSVAGPTAIAIADFNGDGVPDIISSTSTNTDLIIAASEEVTTLQRLYLLDAEGARAAFDTLDQALERVSRQNGTIGAALSRLNSAVANVQSVVENSTIARSRITDVDVAEETAKLVREQILQQAGASILAQANQVPSIVLELLSENSA